MKNKSIIINTLCIATSLLCVALTAWGNFRHGGVITLDSFIGVMATFIGICATIIVGFQIINFLEFYKIKDEIQKVERQRNEYEQMYLKLINDLRLAKNGVSSAFRVLYRLNRNHPLNAIAYIVSIITYVPDVQDQYAPNTLLRSYNKLDRLIENKISKSSITFKRIVKRYLPDIQAAEIPKEIDKYDEIIKIRNRVMSKIELL